MHSFVFRNYDEEKLGSNFNIYYTVSYGEQHLSIYKEEYKKGSSTITGTYEICNLDENSKPFSDNYDRKFCDRIVKQLAFRHDLSTNLICMLPSTFFNSTVYECFDKLLKSEFKESYFDLQKKGLASNDIETELKNKYGEIKSALKSKRNQLLKKQVNLDDLYESL